MKPGWITTLFALCAAGPMVATAQQVAPKAPASKPAAKPVAKPDGEPADAPVAPVAPEFTPAQIEARSLAYQAIAWFEKGEWKRGDEVAAKAIELDVAYELPWRVRGWCAVSSGDDQKAVEWLLHALNLDPANGEVQLMLAGCHRRLGEWGAAKDLLADLMKRSGPTVAILVELADCCAGEEDWKGALVLLAQARTLAPKQRDLVDRVIDVYEKSEDWKAAIAEIRSLLAAAPGEASLRWRLIQGLSNARDYAGAALELEEAARIWKDDPQPHQVLISLYREVVPDAEKLDRHETWLKEWNLRRR